MELQVTLPDIEKSIKDNGRGAITMRLLEKFLPRPRNRKQWIEQIAAATETKWEIKGQSIYFYK